MCTVFLVHLRNSREIIDAELQYIDIGKYYVCDSLRFKCLYTHVHNQIEGFLDAKGL